eukprot:608845-Amorphochlora_amoeboformis.AAC.1
MQTANQCFKVYKCIHSQEHVSSDQEDIRKVLSFLSLFILILLPRLRPSHRIIPPCVPCRALSVIDEAVSAQDSWLQMQQEAKQKSEKGLAELK